MRRSLLAIAVLLLAVLGAAPAHADARVAKVVQLTPTRTALFVDSPAMGKQVQVQILHPAGGGSRPSYYLLDGLAPGDTESVWTVATDAVQFFANKNVNVVLPVGGLASYYTDWQQPDPLLGNYKWETFLTRELPPIIDGQFGGNGVNAVGGLSMGGNAAFTLATRNPWLYRAVAGYSACPDATLSAAATMFSIAARGANPLNMWGLPGSRDWADHDAAINAERLRGKAIYLSTGTGLLGPHDLNLDIELPARIFAGAPVEAMVNVCTVAFEQRLRILGIPARFAYRPSGVHSWPYWQDALHDSWPTIGPAIGA